MIDALKSENTTLATMIRKIGKGKWFDPEDLLQGNLEGLGLGVLDVDGSRYVALDPEPVGLHQDAFPVFLSHA